MPATAEGPTGTQLATRIVREAARLTAALTADRNQARDDAADARRLATIALIIGAAGLLRPLLSRASPGRHPRLGCRDAGCAEASQDLVSGNFPVGLRHSSGVPANHGAERS